MSKKLSSIEPKNGKWRTTETLAVCSECGTIFEKSQLFGMEFANFCPYCGADMREGKESDIYELLQYRK